VYPVTAFKLHKAKTFCWF